MRHASLFSGIGGFDLAAQWMGWENVFQVEIDGFCQKVLEKNFPNIKRYGDIKQFNGKEYRGAIDILTGGFPCQPFSAAGKRKGTEDDRHLWPQMLRVIGEVQPGWVVGENVHGLLNWSGGMVLKQIKTDLENQGFEVFPSLVLPACGVNAPHRRDRVWIVAHSNSQQPKRWGGLGELESEKGKSEGKKDKRKRIWDAFSNCSETITNPNGQQLQRGNPQNEPETSNGHTSFFYARSDKPDWTDFPSKPGVCGGNDGIPNRVDRIKSLGNAIVPQVAFEIFKAIEYVS